MAFKDKVRTKTGRSRGDSLERIVADLNPLMRGWFGYFKHARPHIFSILVGFARRRLRAVLRKQDRRPSMRPSKADHMQWTNAFFADHGLFTLLLPMRKPATGEPCAGEPHARFGGRGQRPPDPYREPCAKVSTAVVGVDGPTASRTKVKLSNSNQGPPARSLSASRSIRPSTCSPYMASMSRSVRCYGANSNVPRWRASLRNKKQPKWCWRAAVALGSSVEPAGPIAFF